jgi:hypothetical protein
VADEDLRALERSWAEGAGDLASGDAFFRALERAGADTGRLIEVRLQVLRGHMAAVGLGNRPLSPMPEVDPLAATFSLPGEEAVAAWFRLRARVDQSAAYPIIVGTTDTYELLLERINESPDVLPESILARAAGVVVSPPEPSPWRDERWPANDIPSTAFLIPAHATNFAFEVYVALLPTRVAWHAAAYLRFDVDRSPEEHVARHRAWAERHAAEPVVMDRDFLEFHVGRPVLSRTDAMRLATEFLDYAPLFRLNALSQPDEVLGALLLGATTWSFVLA